MDPSKSTRQLENTPNKSSPLSKKPKIVDSSPTASQSRMVTNADAVPKGQYRNDSATHLASSNTSARRSLGLESTDAPPTWFVTFFNDFESRFDSRIEALLDKKLSDISLKVSDHDERVKSIEFDMGSLKDSVKQLEKEKEVLIAKLDDLENRGRRKNIVLFGIPEHPNQDHEDCLKTVTDFLQHADVSKDDCSQIERCHRTPTYRSETSSRQPRRIHIAFSSFTTKERVRKACVKKLKESNSKYRDRKVFVAEDLSKRVLQLRQKKQEKFKHLRSEGKKPFFAYPDKIRYRDPTTGKVFSAD
ncbi:uncharacterized protein LOC121421548 [Lytechinus variegatus]|uniref:uncharacterized protein LOC121421548 n=1 Tax=Lytechinus variegatus TaxID=7654 RepID=UPI001BB1DAA2|nr:uncharacterized protein LOC121421548 [Lytechinus variegatus]